MRTSGRSQKLAGVLLPVASRIVRDYTNPALHGLVTVTRVEVSGDLGIAEIQVSQRGGSEKVVPVLKKMRRKVSAEIAKHIATRRVMEVRFVLDASEKLLNKIEGKSGGNMDEV